MSNRYSLSRTGSPRTVYLVIDHEQDDEIATYPATLPDGSPHPRAGRPLAVVHDPAPPAQVPGGARARTWAEIGGRPVAVIEKVPDWAAAPAGAVLAGDPHAFDGIPDDMVYPPSGGLEVLRWFAVPTSWDRVPAGPSSRGSDAVHPHQLRRWQDRYAASAARASSARLALRYLVSRL